jgi:hypothetical protein
MAPSPQREGFVFEKVCKNSKMVGLETDTSQENHSGKCSFTIQHELIQQIAR